MNEYKYSWLVGLKDGNVVQLNGDYLRIDDTCVCSYAETEEPYHQLLLAYIPYEKVDEIQIMNQLTGKANGIIRL